VTRLPARSPVQPARLDQVLARVVVAHLAEAAVVVAAEAGNKSEVKKSEVCRSSPRASESTAELRLLLRTFSLHHFLLRYMYPSLQ
jgi:hypothetical protein